MKEIAFRVPRSEFDKMGLGGFDHVGGGEEMMFRPQWWNGSRAMGLLETDAPIDTEAALTVESIDHLELLREGPPRYEYFVKMEVKLFSVVDEFADEFFIHGPVVMHEDHIEFTFVTNPETYDRIEELTDETEYDIACSILGVNEYRGRSDGFAALTDRQREVLRAAFERGYYDIPRGVSSDDIADEFGLEKSTVLEHLRRAEQNIVDAVLASE